MPQLRGPLCLPPTLAKIPSPRRSASLAPRHTTPCLPGAHQGDLLLYAQSNECGLRPSKPSGAKLTGLLSRAIPRLTVLCLLHLTLMLNLRLHRLALQALVFGNARAIALLWTRFVHELRFRHWETFTPLPHMPGARFGCIQPSTDLDPCILFCFVLPILHT